MSKSRDQLDFAYADERQFITEKLVQKGREMVCYMYIKISVQAIQINIL